MPDRFSLITQNPDDSVNLCFDYMITVFAKFTSQNVYRKRALNSPLPFATLRVGLNWPWRHGGKEFPSFMTSEELKKLFVELLKNMETYRKAHALSYEALTKLVCDLSGDADVRTLRRLLKGENWDQFCYRLSIILACAEILGVSLGLDGGLEALEREKLIKKILW